MSTFPFTAFVLTAVPSFAVSFTNAKGGEKASTKATSAMRTGAALFIYALGLAVIGSLRADVATALAWVVALTSLIINGPIITSAINKAVS